MMNDNNSGTDGSLAIAAFKVMASDPLKRLALARDPTCIGGLVMVLSNSDVQIVKSALETLLLLTECKGEVEFLATFMGMKTQLQNLVANGTADNQVKNMAEKLLSIFSQECNKAVLVKDTSNTSIEGCITPKRAHRRKKNFFLGGHAGKGKTIVLQIKGLKDKADMDICRNNIIHVRGVISITFNFAKKRAIIRTRLDLKPEVLAHAIAMSELMSAEQVLKGDDGNEIFLAFGADLTEDDEHNEADMPQYLPDEPSPVREGDQPLARRGPHEEQSSSWLSKAASFLSTSFYW
ncbi:armadillo repeat-containing protein 1-like isoform X2 [Tubulanus polymorphus]